MRIKADQIIAFLSLVGDGVPQAKEEAGKE
jgi:hypothetical protein